MKKIKTEILRNKNGQVIGIGTTYEIDLSNFGTVFFADHKTGEYIGRCSPENVEKTKCECGGDLKIIKLETTNYDLHLELLLQCQSCKGKYVAEAIRKVQT